MASYIVNNQGNSTACPSCAGEEVVNTTRFAIPATALQVGDIAELGILPSCCRIVDAVLYSSAKADSGGTPALAFDVGIMSGNPGTNDATRTVGNELFAASTAGQTTGTLNRMTKSDGPVLPGVEGDRAIGLKVTAAAATPVPGAIIYLQLRIVAHVNG